METKPKFSSLLPTLKIEVKSDVPLGAIWNEKEHCYIFKSGARIYFHHYKHGKTKVNTMKGLTLENLT